MSQAFQDVKDDMVEVVFTFIDRMNDVCDQDTAEHIVKQYTEAMMPLIEEYIELKFAPHIQHKRLQQILELRTPEEIEAADARRKSGLRTTLLPGFFKETSHDESTPRSDLQR
jgi:hypothetical protein